MRRVVNLDKLEPSLCRVVHPLRTENEVTGVVHPHSNEAVLPTGLLDPSDVELDLVPADRLGRTPWPGDSVSAVYPYPTTHISLASKSAGVEGLPWVVHPGRLESAIRVVHPGVVNPIEGSVGLATVE